MARPRSPRYEALTVALSLVAAVVAGVHVTGTTARLVDVLTLLAAGMGLGVGLARFVARRRRDGSA